MVTLFARLRGRATALPRLLAQFFSRREVEDLQDRLGPEHVLDDARPFGRWRFDLAKAGDVETLRRLVAIRVAAGSASAFHMVRLYPSGAPLPIDGVAGFGKALTPGSRAGCPSRELTDEDLCVGWLKLGSIGILHATLEPAKGAGAAITAPGPSLPPSVVTSNGGKTRGPRKTSAEFDLLPLMLDELDLSAPGSTDNMICSGVGNGEGETHSLFTHGSGSELRRMGGAEPELRVVVVRAPPGVSGQIRIVGGHLSGNEPTEKPFNPAWDGGRTVVLLEVDSVASAPRVVEVLTPRGGTVLATAEVGWASPVRTVIQLDPVAGCCDGTDLVEDRNTPATAQDMASRRQSVRVPASQSPNAASNCGSSPSSPCAGVAGPSSSIRRGFDPARTEALREAKARRRSERRWKQWAPFRRQEPEDFAVQLVT